MKQKLGKKQIKAVEELALNLDELDNKPRRLYEALRKFAEVFTKGNPKDSIKQTLDSIDEAERRYYAYLATPEAISYIAQASAKTKRELLSRENWILREPGKDETEEGKNYHIGVIDGYKRGVEQASRMIIRETVNLITEEDNNL